MANVYTMVDFVVTFMANFIALVRSRLVFTFGFVTVSFFDVMLVYILVGILINVVWKGGRS